MSVLGQALTGPWPFLVSGPYNVKAVKNTSHYTAKITLENKNAQEVLNKAENALTAFMKNTLSLQKLSENEAKELESFHKLGYILKKGTKDGNNYVSVRFPISHGQDVINGLMNVLSIKAPNIVLSTVTLTVSENELQMVFSDFNGCSFVLMNELGTMGCVKGVNEEWEDNHSKPFKNIYPSGYEINGMKRYEVAPADTMYAWDGRMILASHNAVGNNSYNPTAEEQFNIYFEAKEKGSCEIITRESIKKDLELQEKELLPIIKKMKEAVINKDKETGKRCQFSLDSLLKKQEYLGYNVYSWPTNAISQRFNVQYDCLTAIRDSGVVIGLNRNIFERYIEPVFNDMIVNVKKEAGDHVTSVHYNDELLYIYNSKSKFAEPADKKAAQRWAKYGRTVLKL